MSDPTDRRGAGARTSADELRQLRRENKLRAEQLRAHFLDRAERRARRTGFGDLLESLSVDWVTPYAELLDLTRRTGDPVLSGPTGYWQRQRGRNWPIYQTEQELNLLRAPARVLVATNAYAQGMVHGLSSYVVSTGCTYRIAKKQKRVDVPDGMVEACQRIVDEVLKRNQWHGGEQPAMEPELFERSLEDGEFIVTHHARPDGWTDFRTQECEQLTQPPGTDVAEFGFGIETPRDDPQCVKKYYLQFGDSPSDGEEYEPDEVTHFRRNVRRSMKRGITEFAFDAYDAIYLAGKLRKNLSGSAAEQARIIGIRQHDNAAQDDVEAFLDADADFTRQDPLTGKQQRIKIGSTGPEWHDVPKGQNYVAGPTAQSQPIHLQVLQACLRGAVVKWNGFEWLISADASNNNYASSLTAESPFVRRVLQEQRGYREAFRKPVWFGLRHYIKTHGLRVSTNGITRVYQWEEVEPLIDLLVEAPSPETRDKLQESQRAQIEIPLGLDSRQQWAQRQGRDYDQIEADNQEYADKFGQPGQPLPTDVPPDGGLGGSGARTGLPSMESLLESVEDVEVELLEAEAPPGKVWKEITVNRGGKQFKQRRLVNAPKADVKKKPDPKETVAAVKAQLAGDPAKLTPAKVKDLSTKLGTLTVADLKALKAEHDLKGGKTKADHVAKLVDRAKQLKKQADAEKKKGKAAAKTKDAGGLDAAVAQASKAPSRESLRRVVAEAEKARAAGGAHDEDEHIGRVLDAAAVDGGTIEAHGMSAGEPTRKLVLDGVAIHWPYTPEGRRAAIQTVATLAKNDYPEKLWAANRRIVLTGQKNKRDDHWAREYKMPGFTSLATGGDGTIVAYNGNGLAPATFAHESGHNLAKAVWNNTAPDPQSDYGKAQAKEPPVSKYGANSKAEDFAEAVAMYAAPTLRDALKAKAPLKYAALEQILGGFT